MYLFMVRWRMIYIFSSSAHWSLLYFGNKSFPSSECPRSFNLSPKTSYIKTPLKNKYLKLLEYFHSMTVSEISSLPYNSYGTNRQNGKAKACCSINICHPKYIITTLIFERKPNLEH